MANLTSHHVGFAQKRSILRSHESLIFGREEIDIAPNSLQPNLKFYVLVTLLRTHKAVKTRVKLSFTASYLPARSMEFGIRKQVGEENWLNIYSLCR